MTEALRLCRHCGRRIYLMRVDRPGAAQVQEFWEHVGGNRRCKPSARRMAEPADG